MSGGFVTEQYRDELRLRELQAFQTYDTGTWAAGNPFTAVAFASFSTDAFLIIASIELQATAAVTVGLFGCNVDPALTVGNAVRCRIPGGAGSQVNHELAQAVTPTNSGQLALFNVPANQNPMEIIGAGRALGFRNNNGMFLQVQAVAATFFINWTWYEVPN